HPESEEYQTKYFNRYHMVQAETTTATIDTEILEEMKTNDDAWVNRFVKGKWGIPGGQIHSLNDSSILVVGESSGLKEDSEGKKVWYVDQRFIQAIIERGNLCRVLDHGDSAPTCCLWFSSYKGNYYCYREYYKPDALISTHRKNIY